MKLSEFVAETLKEIAEGAAVAQLGIAPLGGIVNPRGPDSPPTAFGNTVVLNSKKKFAEPIEIKFDVAVTASEGTATKGGVGVFMGAVGLGSQGQSEAAKSAVSRIQFSIPLRLKTNEEPNPS